MKLSFSISSKSSSSSSRRNPTVAAPPHRQTEDSSGGGAASEDGTPKPQFVTVFDPSKALTSDASGSHVIPPIPNADLLRPLKKTRNLLPLPLSDDPAASSETRFVLDTFAADPASAGIPYGLSLRSDPSSQEQEVRRSEPAEDLVLRRFHEDMKNLPDDRGFDEFDDIPVEGFGAALLAGYGWSEGKGIGRNNKGDTKVVQYDRRAGTLGLGYAPSPTDPKSSKQKRNGVAPHEEKKQQVDSEKIVRIISGRHIGSKGRVVKRLERSQLLLKLLRSGDEVRVGEDTVAELGTVEEEKCLKKLKELEIRGTDEGRKEKRSRDSRREEKRSRDEDVKQADGSHDKSSSDEVRWLRSHIRVRIISRGFRGGKFYKKKGEVVDVVGPTTCDVSMDESRELVQGVDQEILETVLPKGGGSVLVLYGKHKGVFGSLVERDMEEETGVVRDADSHALINVRLDQIAEFVGDPSYLGY